MIPQGIVTLVAHDSGGAEILSSWLKFHPRKHYVVLRGPAIKIFNKKFKFCKFKNLKEAIDKCDWVLTGTGWQTDLECEAINLAKKNKKKTISFIDHWSNYRKRFIRKNNFCFPDELWVGDKYALKIAKKELPEIGKINLVNNPYFQEAKKVIKKYSHKTPSKKKNILYVTEPTSSHALKLKFDKKHWGYTEYDALRFFLDNVDKIISKNLGKITIKLHPAEKKEKYKFIIKDFDKHLIKISKNVSLFEEIALHEVIVGCNTTPMAIGLLCGKKVFSSIPPSGRKCQLPHVNIKMIRNLV